MSRRWIAFCAMAGLACGGPRDASAHAFLKHADPPVGASVAAAPAGIGIDFTESVEPAFCAVTVQDSSGARVDRNDLHGSGTHLAISVRTLPAGTYTVEWHATSTDTHKTQGRYRFTVAPQ